MSRPIVRRSSGPTDHLPGHLHPVLKRVFAARGVASVDELDVRLGALPRFEALANIDPACELLASALIDQRRITVVGDFDADGATSVALSVTALRAMGAQRVDWTVPDRFRFGYGLTPALVETLLADKPDVLITVDNGISSVAGVAKARAAGIAVLVTDHHLAPAVLPQAEVIVNPNQPGCAFPVKALAGVGVIFYVMLALRSRLRERGAFAGNREPRLADLLDLVALGTVADLVPLVQANRILVEQGLRRIRAGACRPAIVALLSAAGRDPTRATAGDLAFAVAPRLNAAGRLDDMGHGIRCLLAQDEAQAERLAVKLDTLNRERRTLETRMRDEAFAALERLNLTDAELPHGLVLFDPDWHAGIVGLVASRVRERWHRPVVAFAPEDGESLKGSARSVSGFHLRDALAEVERRAPGLIARFGGHAAAAGLSLPRAHLARFSELFAAVVKVRVDSRSLSGRIQTDGELTRADIGLPLAQALRAAGPWGQGFSEPLFDGCFEVLERRVVGNSHLKLRLAVGDGQTVDAIAFNQADADLGGYRIRAVYRLDVNQYRGRTAAQLVIEYLAPE